MGGREKEITISTHRRVYSYDATVLPKKRKKKRREGEGSQHRLKEKTGDLG